MNTDTAEPTTTHTASTLGELPRNTDEPVTTYDAERTCTSCTRRLSIHNPGTRCASCTPRRPW